MSTNSSDKHLIEKLQSNNSSDVYNALVKIRTCYINNYDKMKRLERYCIIEIILSFLEHPKLCNVSLSLIANACLQDNLRAQVIEKNGIKSLIRIMKSLANDDIQNRACRALGNIALSETGYNAVHKMNPVFHIVQFLTGTEDVNCQQTAVRTLRILGNSSKARKIIVDENGILSIAKLLQSKHKDVLHCSIKALAILTQNCTIGCARQLLEFESIPKLVELYAHSDKQIQENALMSLRNLTYQEEIRSTLVKVGAVQLFIKIASSANLYKLKKLAALALCSCLDHMHMWEQYNISKMDGLKVLLEFLHNQENSDIHLKIIHSLFPLCFEFETVDILLELKLVQILVTILKRYSELNKCIHTLAEISEDVVDKTNITCENICPVNDRKFIFDDVNLSENWDSSGDGYCSETDIPDLETAIDKSMIKSMEEGSLKVSDKRSKSANSTHREFSIDSPSYKGIQKSDTTLSVYSHSSGYSSYCSPSSPYQHCSPGSNTMNCGSPQGLYNWNPSPPFSDSSFAGSMSPTSDDPDDYPLCWSPVLSVHSNSPEPDFNELDNVSQSISINTPVSAQIKHGGPSEFICKNVKSCKEDQTSTSVDSFKLENQLPSSVINTENSKFKCAIDSSEFQDDNNIKKDSGKKRSISILKLEHLDSKEENLTNDSDLTNAKKKQKIQSLEKTSSNVKKSIVNGSITGQVNNKQKKEMDYYVLVLLLQISSRLEKKPNSVIASKACFSVLMDYLRYVPDPNPKAGKVLLKLVKNRYSFEKLIMCGFMSEMEERMPVPHSSQSCSRCGKMDDIKQSLLLACQLEAESDYGVGTLSHILLTTDKSTQLHALYAFSKFVTHKKGLHELLFNSDGLSFLLNFLSGDDEKIQQFAAVCLCYLYCNLSKAEKNENATHTKHLNCSVMPLSNSNCNYINSKHDILFLLDDGITVKASRKMLSENSEYFSALLEGFFSEKHQEVVSLPDITEVVISTIFHFLHGCHEESCEFIQEIPFEVLIGLLSECDRFLLFNIKHFAEERLGNSLQPATIPKVYRYSKMHNSPNLTKKAIHFALSLDVLHKDHFTKCFHDLIVLQPEFDFLNDVKILVKNQFLGLSKTDMKYMRKSTM